MELAHFGMGGSVHQTTDLLCDCSLNFRALPFQQGESCRDCLGVQLEELEHLHKDIVENHVLSADAGRVDFPCAHQICSLVPCALRECILLLQLHMYALRGEPELHSRSRRVPLHVEAYTRTRHAPPWETHTRSSMQPLQTSTSACTCALTRLDRDESMDPMALLAYYRRLLPFRSLFTWLNQDVAPTRNFVNREFAFTLQNDVYLRYQSFQTWDEWKKEVCRLNPSRFEIGPVYSLKPKDRKTLQRATFRPVARELVFDIDMTDYDEIRTCCSGKAICARCWQFIAVAVEVLDAVLREDFGLTHILWVYSGRRGIHCWVSDSEACSLLDEARRAIVGWIEVIKGGQNQIKKVELGGGSRVLHPSLRRALGSNILQTSATAPAAPTAAPLQRAFIDTVVRDQDCFRESTHFETLLDLLPQEEAVSRLRTRWGSAPRSSVAKWDDVLEIARKSSDRAKPVWIAALEDIVIQYTYPRIDSEVSRRQNHLLKSPFVVHPSTGRVCVPLELDQVRTFDPQNGAPTVAQLLRELTRFEAQHGVQEADSDRRAEWDRTSLRPFVEQLDRLSARIMRDMRDAKRAATRHSLDF